MNEKKWYVYLLCDPDTKEPFYVGKGTGDRINQHEINSADCNKAKLATIHLIQDQGKQVLKKKVAEFSLESDAYLYEWALINLYHEQITNIKGTVGRVRSQKYPVRNFGLLSAEECRTIIHGALRELDITIHRDYYVTPEDAARILNWRANFELGIQRDYQTVKKNRTRYDYQRLFRVPLSEVPY